MIYHKISFEIMLLVLKLDESFPNFLILTFHVIDIFEILELSLFHPCQNKFPGKESRFFGDLLRVGR